MLGQCYAERIGREWDKSADAFNEFYFKRAIARGIVFRSSERIVSAQPWYNSGYRANIVAYTLALLGEVARRRKEHIDFMAVWDAQAIGPELESAIAAAAAIVIADVTTPPRGISNVTEWCKRDSCWTRIRDRAEQLERSVPAGFLDRLVSHEAQVGTSRTARKTQQVDDGIEARRKVLAVPAGEWARIHQLLTEKEMLSSKEAGILKVAMQIPAKVPSDKQSQVLLTILQKAHLEGVALAC